MPQKDLHSRTGRDEKKGKTQENTERESRKRSSSAGSEKMERVGGRQEKMEGHCSTGQSPQWAVVPMAEEEEEEEEERGGGEEEEEEQQEEKEEEKSLSVVFRHRLQARSCGNFGG